MFEEGKRYTTTCWFTGGILTFTVVNRTESTVVMQERATEIDGNWNHGLREFPTQFDDQGEYIVIGGYRDVEHRLYATS